MLKKKMSRKIDTLVSELNKEIKGLQFGSYPAELYEPIEYILSLGGKRMRPLLTLLAYCIKKDDWEKVLKPAIAVEVFHNFTLLHDDIMDKAPLRRGKPTVHSKWNDNVAILSGDTMMIQAYELLLEAKTDDLSYILKLFNRCAVEVCEGQQLDMNFESESSIEEVDYINMIMLKTAVLIGFSLELGGLLGGMSHEEASKLRNFGIHMGIGFQLKDDLLDVYGDQKKFGKQVGGDIIANKKTFLLIKALGLSNNDQKKALNQWIEKEDFDPKEKVEAVKGIYDTMGIKELTEEKMNQFFDKAFNSLDQLEEPAESFEELKEFAKTIIEREK
ncbi:MAG: geranylgeranyl diphosphate synthase type II [Cyclobacteriaceae bacterium]|jgi:geranylgeranyl diphosphate synthase type II